MRQLSPALSSAFSAECPVLRLEESGLLTVTSLPFVLVLSSLHSVEEFSSYFLSVPYLGLHLAFSWEMCLSALLTLLFVLFAEDLEVHVLLILLTNLLPRPRPLV